MNTSLPTVKCLTSWCNTQIEPTNDSDEINANHFCETCRDDMRDRWKDYSDRLSLVHLALREEYRRQLLNDRTKPKRGYDQY